jgi:hypothetical protein
MFQRTLDFAKEISKQKVNNMDVSAYHDELLADLKVLPDEAYGAIERLRAQVKFPSPDMPPEEFVVADQNLFRQMR